MLEVYNEVIENNNSKIHPSDVSHKAEVNTSFLDIQSFSHMWRDFRRVKAGKRLCILLCIYKHFDFLVWIYSKCPISILSKHCVVFKLRGEGRVTKCVCGTSTTSRTLISSISDANIGLINLLCRHL